ncbi:2914_t:CDS:2 [Diversispora eburnea]|uniref:2914_t:CDS:1 n=1 Tax=Diversispora eburnea TaxID=1213867 RepID=A0A9N9AU10_9GLOM|nr:2914_t:CDS:2 [Diversispora eburnea]
MDQFYHNNNKFKDILLLKPRSTTPTIPNFQGPGPTKQDDLEFIANGGRLPQES